MAYKDKNKEKETRSRYYRNNRGKRLEYSKQYYVGHKDIIIKKINSWHKERDDGLYFKYLSMLRRCKYKSQYNYKWYGAKGIRVLWKSYPEFKKDMYSSYKKHRLRYGHGNTTLDRKDPSGHYCMVNCRWATVFQQLSSNRSNLKNIV